MSSTTKPMPFDVDRWLGSSRIAACEESTRGVLIDLLCFMWANGRKKSVAAPIEQLAGIARTTPIKLLIALGDAGRCKVIEFQTTGSMCSLRMIHDTGVPLLLVDHRIRNELTRIRRIKIIDRLTARDGYVCRKCSSRSKLTIDHKIPVSLGGDNRLANLQFLCQSCNSSKGARYAD